MRIRFWNSVFILCLLCTALSPVLQGQAVVKPLQCLIERQDERFQLARQILDWQADARFAGTNFCRCI